jgi:hypothetical protein
LNADAEEPAIEAAVADGRIVSETAEHFRALAAHDPDTVGEVLATLPSDERIVAANGAT